MRIERDGEPGGLADGDDAAAPATAAALPQRLLNFVLFVTVLLSSIAFIEPSPHDALMIVLLVMCVARAFASTASSFRC